jgi:hypothetical protein
MTMPVRRVVTGHDENGNAVVVSDERLAAVSRGVGTGISGCQMWSTNRMPIDNSAAADAAQRATVPRLRTTWLCCRATIDIYFETAFSSARVLVDLVVCVSRHGGGGQRVRSPQLAF